jgi:hypothetical protein
MQKLYHVTFKARLATAQQLLVRPERVLCFLPSYKLCCDSTEAMMSGNGWGKMTVSSGYILKTLFLRDTAFAAYIEHLGDPRPVAIADLNGIPDCLEFSLPCLSIAGFFGFSPKGVEFAGEIAQGKASLLSQRPHVKLYARFLNRQSCLT